MFSAIVNGPGDEPVFRIDRLITAFGFGDRVAGGFHLAAPLVQGGVVAAWAIYFRGGWSLEAAEAVCAFCRSKARLGRTLPVVEVTAG